MDTTTRAADRRLQRVLAERLPEFEGEIFRLLEEQHTYALERRTLMLVSVAGQLLGLRVGMVAAGYTPAQADAAQEAAEQRLRVRLMEEALTPKSE